MGYRNTICSERNKIFHWYVELKIHDRLQNVQRNIKCAIYKKLTRILKGLPDYLEGIPNVEEKILPEYIIYNGIGISMIALGNIIITVNGNIIKMKEDKSNIFVNEILRNCPDDIYLKIKDQF